MYWKFERLGCYLCPKQNLDSLRSLRNHYRLLWDKMLQMDKDSPISFKADGTTLRDIEDRFRYEESQNIIDLLSLVERRLFFRSEQISFK